MSERFHFGKRNLEALELLEGRRYYVHDDVVRGLALIVFPTGKKSFYLFRKLNGKPERIHIGGFPEFTPDQARREAEKLNAAIASGSNPADKRREVRAEMTLQELYDSWLLLYAKVHKKSSKGEEWVFEKYLHSWKFRRLSTISRQDVIELHARVGRSHGRYSANRTVELLSSMWNRARSDWGLTLANPAEKIKPFKEVKRQRFLDASELPRFFESLSIEPNATMRDFFLVALFTGARRSNVQEMRWQEVNWHRAEWLIPAEKAKSGESVTVALVPAVAEILAKRKASSLSEWVFPSTGKTGHLVEPKSCWKRILKRAKLEDVRMHDLRRTLGSWQAALGTSLPIIGKSLGHTSLEATQIYSRLNLDPVRASVTAAVGAMLALKPAEEK